MVKLILYDIKRETKDLKLMKIAMLCSAHPVNDARVTHKQAVSLAKAGHEVVVFGQKPNKDEQIPHVILRPVGPKDDSFPKRFAMIFKLYRAAVLWRPDVVICHEPESAIVGLILKLRHGMKTVYDAHECIQETLARRMPKVLRFVVRGIVVLLLKMIARWSDWITVVSPPNFKFLGGMRKDNRIDILHNSPVIEYFPLCNHDINEPLTIVHEGYLSFDRGLIQMLEAVATVRRSHDIRLLVLGRMGAVEQKVFDKKVAQLDLKEILIFPGWVPLLEMGKVESTAQIGLICFQKTPNNFMSLSNKLYNYMSCGQAIVGPAGSATEEIITKYNCGICVDTSNPDEIAEAIVQLCSNTEMRRQMGANGRKAIEDELGWHKMEEVLIRIYSQLGT